MPSLTQIAASWFGPGPEPSRAERTTPTNWDAGHDPSWRLPVANHHKRSASASASASATSCTLPTSSPTPSTPSASAPPLGQDAAYPRLAPTWSRIRKWCHKQFPELQDTINLPASAEAIQEFERRLGRRLPPAVRESFELVNGQDNESLSDGALARSRAGLVLGLPMLSIEEALAEWSYWRHVDSDPSSGAHADVRSNMASCPDGWVSAQYSNPDWVPLVSDRMGNYIGVDLSPPALGCERSTGPSLSDAMASTSIVNLGQGNRPGYSAAPLRDLIGSSHIGLPHSSASPPLSPSPHELPGHGQVGQVIIFGRDFDTKVVLHTGSGKGGWAHFLAYLADTLEARTLFTLDEELGESGDEEDYIGYENYFGSTTGSNAVGGGLASEHLGGYGFRLCSPYKGISVLEMLADQSVQHWEALGYLRGVSPAEVAWRQTRQAQTEAAQAEQAEQDPQHVLTDEPIPEEEEHREQHLVDPLNNVRYPSAAASAATAWAARQSTGTDHPLSPASETFSNCSRSSTSTTDSGTATSRRKPPPPPQSVDVLALPTIEDVRAVRDKALHDALGEDYQDILATAQRNANRTSNFFTSVTSWTQTAPTPFPSADLEAGMDHVDEPKNRSSWTRYFPSTTVRSPPSNSIGLTSSSRPHHGSSNSLSRPSYGTNVVHDVPWAKARAQSAQ